MVSIEGEAMRSVTWCLVEEVASGEWGFGGQTPTTDDVMFAAELAQLAHTHPGYRLYVRATRSEGRLDLRRLGDEVADWRERETWACGPEGMLNAAERVWADAGLPSSTAARRGTTS